MRKRSSTAVSTYVLIIAQIILRKREEMAKGGPKVGLNKLNRVKVHF